MNTGQGKGEVKKAICNMCSVRCGIELYVENGVIKRAAAMKEFPRIDPSCPRLARLMDVIHSPERITSPMRRVDGKWVQISWDEALSFISDKLNRIKEEYGARALFAYSGNAFSGGSPDRAPMVRFCDLYGTPNYVTGATVCHWARVIGHSLTFDHKRIHLETPDFANSNCIIIWGRNPNESGHAVVGKILAAKERGAKLIVIDPRAIPLAKEADIHARIRPNTDCALALGLLNVIIAEELYDKTFVANWTVGFDQLAEHVKGYTPENVQDITWVPAEMVRNIARTYATSKPANIYQGISLDHSSNGIQATRAVAILIAITGNFDIPGGTIASPELKTTRLNIPGAISLEDAVGARYPLFTKIVGRATASPITEAILTGKPYPIKAGIIQGADLALTWPNSTRVREAFAKLDLLVVMDLFMTNTAELAHVFLPAATFPESAFFRMYGVFGLLLVARAAQAIEPPGQCMDDWKLWCELGKKMGYGEYFPWKDADDLIQTLIEPSGITLEQLKQNPAGIYYSQHEEKGYLKKGFNTPSGKVEIYSKLMEQHGYDPLPTFSEPLETHISDKLDLDNGYPLILISGPRVDLFTHSRYRNIPALRQQMPEPLVEINTETAKKLDITDGSMVDVESARGQIKLKAKVTEDIHPVVISILHGWAEANVNILTDNLDVDPVSGYPAFRSVLCRVKTS